MIVRSSEATAAKIIIFESGKVKMNGPDPQLLDGVCVLIRLPASAPERSLGVAPMQHERFAYFRLLEAQGHGYERKKKEEHGTSPTCPSI